LRSVCHLLRRESSPSRRHVPPLEEILAVSSAAVWNREFIPEDGLIQVQRLAMSRIAQHGPVSCHNAPAVAAVEKRGQRASSALAWTVGSCVLALRALPSAFITLCDRGFSRCALLDIAHVAGGIKLHPTTPVCKCVHPETRERGYGQSSNSGGGGTVTLGLIVSLAIAIALTQVATFSIGVGWGLLAAGLHGTIYVFFLSSSINGLCHMRGYRT